MDGYQLPHDEESPQQAFDRISKEAGMDIDRAVRSRYYIVCVDDDGDVLAIEAQLVQRKGLMMTVRTDEDNHDNVAFENQGDDNVSKWESASSALACVMPED